MQVEQLAIGRRGVNLKVAGMNHDSEGSVDRQRHTIHQAMCDSYRMDKKWSDAEAFVSANLVELRGVEQVVLFQLAFHQGERELRAINRNIQLGEDPRESTNVIFVAMGKQNGANFVAIFE